MAQTKIKKVSATTQFEDEEQKKKALDTVVGIVVGALATGLIYMIAQNI